MPPCRPNASAILAETKEEFVCQEQSGRTREQIHGETIDAIVKFLRERGVLPAQASVPVASRSSSRPVRIAPLAVKTQLAVQKKRTGKTPHVPLVKRWGAIKVREIVNRRDGRHGRLRPPQLRPGETRGPGVLG
jgi:hypothetical protein